MFEDLPWKAAKPGFRKSFLENFNWVLLWDGNRSFRPHVFSPRLLSPIFSSHLNMQYISFF